MIGYIYKIENTVDGKIYVGKAKNYKHRWNDHRCRSRHEKNRNKLYLAVRKYGLHNFKFSLYASVLDYEIHSTELEKEIIADHDSYRKGYNSTKGGEGAPLGQRERISYIGKVFNNLTIISDAEDRISEAGNMSRRVVCQCICGTIKQQVLGNVINNRVTSCGCERPMAHNFIDYTGKRFGHLTIIDARFSKLVRGDSRKVLCQCDCGKTKNIYMAAIVAGKIKTCGCFMGFFEKRLTALGEVFYNVRAAAIKFKVNVRTVRRWLEKGTNEAKWI